MQDQNQPLQTNIATPAAQPMADTPPKQLADYIPRLRRKITKTIVIFTVVLICFVSIGIVTGFMAIEDADYSKSNSVNTEAQK